MRKITTGITGGPILGQLSAFQNAVSGVVANADISLSPSGTGEVLINSHIQIRSNETLKLNDSDNSNFVGIKGPATVTSDVTYVLPASPTADFVLSTDASGNLSWVSQEIAINNQTADTNTYYPAMTTATSGGVTALSVSNSKMSFQPSTGNLTIAGLLSAGSGSFTGNMSAQSITETSSITLKENVNPIENALDKIMNLVGVEYDRKDGSSKNEAGLIAEEVNKVLPNLVKKNDNGDPESIYYTKLSAYLIEAVKSLKEEIEILKGK